MRKIRIARTRNRARATRRFLSGCKDLLNIFKAPLERQRKEDLAAAKLEKLFQDREIGEIEKEIKANKLVLLDIQIEEKKLELLALKRKVGDPDKEFIP